jgi:hypothetical protein
VSSSNGQSVAAYCVPNRVEGTVAALLAEVRGET